jgi:hypothetical protein
LQADANGKQFAKTKCQFGPFSFLTVAYNRSRSARFEKSH